MKSTAAFKALQSLVGGWSGVTETGQQLRVAYSLHAHDSVLMEHWQLRTTDALTLYHMDGPLLMATHYCPLCNQPRLNFVDTHNDAFRFIFASSTNLTDVDDEHQHAFQIKLIDARQFWRSESYIRDAVVHDYPVTYYRDRIV
jgi:hypothetical protein